MLDICLQILTILGVSALVLLGAAVIVILLVLFYPISYHVRGARDDEGLRINAKAGWLAGALRIKWQYPEPGRITVKLFCFTLFSGRISSEKGEENSASRTKKKSPPKTKTKPKNKPETAVSREQEINVSREGAEEQAQADGEPSAAYGEERSQGKEERGKDREQPEGKIFLKFQKIKYTIFGIYDKIKEIWDTIVYNAELLQEEETRQLLLHIRLRLGKMLRILRPRRMKAEVLFGTGEPDITGYAYGVYCMFLPILGTGLQVTPDFEHRVLRAQFDVKGRFALWVLAVNGLALARDRRLRRVWKRLGKREKSAA